VIFQVVLVMVVRMIKATPPNIAIIVSAGRGQRAGGGVPKQYRQLPNGQSALQMSVAAFAAHPQIGAICVVIHPDDKSLYDQQMLAQAKLLPPAAGGATRQQSVQNGLAACRAHAPVAILIHDAARPFISLSMIDRGLTALEGHDGAIPTLPIIDSVKRIDGAQIIGTEARETLVRAQTPQIFTFAAIGKAHAQADQDDAPDDATLAMQAGLDLVIFDGEPQNIKLTFEEDLEATPMSSAVSFRTGFGFDVHQFGPAGSSAVVRIAGCDIPYDRRLLGHSDADVALHALTDAILGALAMGDIGDHFPPSDAAHKDRDSADFVSFAVKAARQRHAEISHVDLTIICQAPKIAPHREAMRDKLAQLIGLKRDQVSVKATTTEGLGFTGRGEGVAVQAVATLKVAL